MSKLLKFKLVGGTIVQVPASLSSETLIGRTARSLSDYVASEGAVERIGDALKSNEPGMKSRLTTMRIDPSCVQWSDINFNFDTPENAQSPTGGHVSPCYADVSIESAEPLRSPNDDQSSNRRMLVRLSASTVFERTPFGFIPFTGEFP